MSVPAACIVTSLDYYTNSRCSFIDYEKAYDNRNRDKLWEMMDNKIPNYLLNTIKCIYRNMKVRIKSIMVYLNQFT